MAAKRSSPYKTRRVVNNSMKKKKTRVRSESPTPRKEHVQKYNILKHAGDRIREK